MATREREKALKRKAERQDNPGFASLRGLKMSARKVRVLADMIRGQGLEEAMTRLLVQAKASARPLRRLLQSAAANAEERGLNVDRLRVSEILVHKGPISHRFMPRAQGRATKIRKQSSHVDVQLKEVK